MSPGQISLLGLFLPASLHTPTRRGPVAGEVAVQHESPLPRCCYGGFQSRTKGHPCTLAPASGLLLLGSNTDKKWLLLMSSSVIGGSFKGCSGDAAGAWQAGELAAGMFSSLY